MLAQKGGMLINVCRLLTLFLMYLARCANFNVLNVSAAQLDRKREVSDV